MASEHSDHLMIGSLITVAARSDDIVTIIHAEVVPGDIDAEFLNGMHLRFVNHVLQNGNEAQHKVRIFFCISQNTTGHRIQCVLAKKVVISKTP